MKIEYVISAIIGLFIFGYILDLISAPFAIVLTSPFGFLQPELLSTYPFTAVSILVKTIAVFLSATLLIQSLTQRRFYLAGTLFFVTAALMELYAVQQIATQAFLISLQWTLALSYGAVFLLIPCIIYFALGIFTSAHRNLSADRYTEPVSE